MAVNFKPCNRPAGGLSAANTTTYTKSLVRSSLGLLTYFPRLGTSLEKKCLLTWFQTVLTPYSNINVTDLNDSWRDGLALCAVIHHFRPAVCDLRYLQQLDDVRERVRDALNLVEQEFGVEPMLSSDDWCQEGCVDKLSMLSYLAQINEAIEQEPPPKGKEIM